MQEEEYVLPISIFHENLTPLESVVLYLKDKKKLKLHEIADIVKRDQRNIWRVYHRASKVNVKFSVQDVKYWIPLSVFDNQLSIFEAIVEYLKESYGLSYHEISRLMKRDDRTIWTVYQRARKKHGKR